MLARHARTRYDVRMKNTRGGVRLRDWLREERRTQEWLGEQIGTHQTNVSRWILGREPPLAMALAVKEITGIDPADWLLPADESTPVLAGDDAHEGAA